MSIAKLSIDLEAKLANLQAGLDKAGLLAEKQAARIESAFGGLKSLASGVGAGLVAGFTVGGLTSMIRSTVDGLDRLNDLKDATGASIENLSALEDIALRTGTSMDTVADSVVKLNKALGDATPGSGAESAFKALGLSVANLKALDPAEALRQVALALSGYADDGNKARLVQELFGKSLQQVAPLLKDLAESGALTAKVTTEQALAAEAFNKQLFALQKNLTDVGRVLAGPIIKDFNDLADKLGKAEGALSKFAVVWQALVGGSRDFQGEIISKLLGKTPESELAKMNARLSELNSLLDTNRRLGLAIGQAPALEAERKQLQGRIALAKAMAQAGDPANYGNESRREAFRPSVGDVAAKPKDGKKPTKPAAEFVGPVMSEGLQDALKRLEQTDTAKIAALNAELQQLLTLPASDQQAQAIAAVRAELERLDPAAQAAAEAAKRLQQILGDTETGKLQSALVDIQLINAAFASGKIEADQWAQAALAISGKLQPAAEEAKQAGREVGDELALVFSSAAGQAITQFQDLRGVLKGVLADLAQIALRETVTKPLTAMLTSGLSGLFGGLPKFASGIDYVPRDMPAIIHKGERVVPAAENRRGRSRGQSLTFAPNIYIDSRTDQAAVAQAVAQGVAAGQRQMLERMKAAGVAA